MAEHFVATRTLSAQEARIPLVVDQARSRTFAEALDLAQMSLRGQPLPQDHAIDEAERPTDDGGLIIERIIILP